MNILRFLIALAIFLVLAGAIYFIWLKTSKQEVPPFPNQQLPPAVTNGLPIPDFGEEPTDFYGADREKPGDITATIRDNLSVTSTTGLETEEQAEPQIIQRKTIRIRTSGIDEVGTDETSIESNENVDFGSAAITSESVSTSTSTTTSNDFCAENENLVSSIVNNHLHIQDGICTDKCGDGFCAQIVCLGSGCPCAEAPASCPSDCQ